MNAAQTLAFRRLSIELSHHARSGEALDWVLVAGYMETLDGGSGFLEGPACDPIFDKVQTARREEDDS